MKIVHFILGRASLNTSNGVNKVIAGLAKYCNKQGDDVTVVGLSSKQSVHFELIKRDGFEVESYRTFRNGCFIRIKELAETCDVVHLHSVWNNYNLVVAAHLRKIGKPYVITAHSGLTEDRLRQSRYWFKKGYHFLFQKKLFDKAAGVHALTKEESTVLRKHTTNKNIFIVHNGQDLQGRKLVSKSYKNNDNKIKIGFIGRLSVEKNIDGLINALGLLPQKIIQKVSLHLIGPMGMSKQQLDSIIFSLQLESNVKFLGVLYGEDKEHALSDLDFYIHPAHSDVVSIAVMEAMCLGLPSVITRTSDVSYFYNSGAFVMVEPNANDIASGIVEMVNNRDSWSEMSSNAIELVENIFNWEVSSHQLVQEYQKVIKS